eukprot:CAMPEP_0180664760 /NCGR_PEP_ID=MMETSP1037_2-20121125/60837_1 /TAXON_ID=632150 /ORGANISM="Azadinium spinosum, Strain 3D9" /LENGTH=72 /DNA_ID=CAMNT_0022692991 /DNA_START=37 /DNA_END=255 /DNA_ORIENTATION=+
MAEPRSDEVLNEQLSHFRLQLDVFLQYGGHKLLLEILNCAKDLVDLRVTNGFRRIHEARALAANTVDGIALG